jgi:hypothetical protein
MYNHFFVRFILQILWILLNVYRYVYSAFGILLDLFYIHAVSSPDRRRITTAKIFFITSKPFDRVTSSYIFLLDRCKEAAEQGCQMACFLTKSPTWGKLWRALEWKKVGILPIWPFGICILRSLSIFDGHLVI